MSRDDAISFGDLLGKLDVLQVACDKCGRKGRGFTPTGQLAINGRAPATSGGSPGRAGLSGFCRGYSPTV